MQPGKKLLIFSIKPDKPAASIDYAAATLI
jgi:hypothetical protein